MKKTLWNMMSVFVMLGILVFQPLPIKGGPDVLKSEQGANYAITEITTVSASQATYAQEGFPDTPTGSSQRNMYVGYDSWYNKKRTRIFVKFDLPDLGQVTIISAKIQIGQYACEASSSYDVTAYRVTDSWGESTLTWNNQPGKAESVGNATFSTGDGTKEINITELVKQWYSGTYSNKGVAIRRNTESSAGGVFCSRSGTSDQCQNQIHPRLRIEYQISVDTTAPTGNLTAPTEGAKVGPGQVAVAVDASDNAGGTGVQSVKFKVVYDGQWHDIGTDTTTPYGVSWTTPTGLRSQQIRFATDVTDNAGNVAIDAGGQKIVNFVESQGNPSVIENWVPKSKRAYLNQRSLSPYGDSKCGSASAAMMLAMNGLIGKDYNSLRDTANAIYPKTIKDGQIWLYLITAQMRARGLNASEKNKSANDAWKTIKSEINAGRPVMVLSRKVTAGHFFVIVGYREEGSSRKIIVYDPYGRWLGSYQRYDRNTTAADSTKGKWVTYDYNASWGGGWIVTGRPYAQAMAADEALVLLDDNDPDPISEEPLEEVIYEGQLINESQFIYLPLVMREN